MMFRYLSPLALVAAPAAAPAAAQPLADLAAIDRAVAAFAGVGAGGTGGAAQPVDRRLRLAACAAPLALGWYGSRQDMVEVRCPSAPGWRIYVPLAGTAREAAAAPLVSRGDAVTIAVTGQGFTVSQGGEALESGAEGAWTKVRGAGQGAQVLRGRVLRPGLVGIDLP